MFDHCLGILRGIPPVSILPPMVQWITNDACEGNQFCFVVLKEPIFHQPSLPWEENCCNIYHLVLGLVLLTFTSSHYEMNKKQRFTFLSHCPHFEDLKYNFHFTAYGLQRLHLFFGSSRSSFANFPNQMVEL